MKLPFLKNVLVVTINTFSFFVLGYGQREIVPLPLNKLNRDSLNKIIAQKEKQRDYQTLGEIYGGLFTYFVETNYQDSVFIYESKAEECQYKAGDSARYYFTELQMGDFCTNASNYELAKAYYQKALSFYLYTRNYKMLTH